MIRLLHFLGSATGKATTAMAERWGGVRQGACSAWGGGTSGPAGSADSETEKAMSQSPTRLYAATHAPSSALLARAAWSAFVTPRCYDLV